MRERNKTEEKDQIDIKTDKQNTKSESLQLNIMNKRARERKTEICETEETEY